MARLTFYQLCKIFTAGLVGYLILLLFASLVFAALFPTFIKSRIDMSIGNFLEYVMFYFGLLGVAAAPLMLIGAWLILRILRQAVRLMRFGSRPG
jgi:hypothetical protein